MRGKVKVFNIDKENGVCKIEVTGYFGDVFLYEEVEFAEQSDCIDLTIHTEPKLVSAGRFWEGEAPHNETESATPKTKARKGVQLT